MPYLKIKNPFKTSTIYSKTLAFLAGFLLATVVGLVFFVTPARSTSAPPATPLPAQSGVKAQHKKTLYFQHRSDFWAHRRGTHYKLAHRKLKPTTSLAYEQYRTRTWMKKERIQHALFLQWAEAKRKCAQAGMPRRLCGPAVSAVVAAGVPISWSYSRDLVQLIFHESSFRPTADNGACYGLFQFQDGTWVSTRVRKTSDPYRQFVGGYRYIKGRYGNPNHAWSFWQSHSPHWY